MIRKLTNWELTETYSPAAMDMAPATSPATPDSNTSDFEAAAEATPRIRLAVEMIPSFAPSTAALSHPIRRDGSHATVRLTLLGSLLPFPEYVTSPGGSERDEHPKELGVPPRRFNRWLADFKFFTDWE
jgi:hypothetical protein